MKTALLLVSLQLVGHGSEPWVRHTIDSSSEGADGIRLADINRDDLMDITTGWEEGGVVRAYLHPGYTKRNKNGPPLPWAESNRPKTRYSQIWMATGTSTW
jgi:hypothetical protein